MIAVVPIGAAGQTTDASHFVFDDSSVPEVRIVLSQQDFDSLFAPGNQFSDEERLAAFEFKRDGETFRVDSVGFRLRGNTSRDAAKKSFKVSFNTFRPGGEFFDLEKLNLNGEHNDPSIVRAKVSWDLFQSRQLPASRANHISLYLNGQYFGIYLNVEHVDEKFLARHFGNNAGNLYKCLWPADLRFLGTSADAYRPTGESRRPYDLKLKDDDLQGYHDLARFITILNTTEDARFAQELAQVFNVSGFLRAHAVTVLLGSWDSYWFLKNNFYLYFNTNTGKFEYIPFDFDNVMGIWWDGIEPGLDWTTRDIYDWGHPTEARPLLDRILSEPAFRDMYSFYLRRLLAESFDRGSMESRLLLLRDTVAVYAETDPFRPMDYGFTIEDFRDSYFGPLSNHGHVVEGIVPYIEQRAMTATAQVEQVNVRPIISDLSVSPSRARPSGEVRFTVRVEDESVDGVELHYWLGAPVENVVDMTPSPEFGRDMYAAVVVAQDSDGFIDYRVEARDAAGQRSITALETLEVGEAVSLFINEFMASNQSTIRDPANEFDDWIELYNGGVTTLSLAGFFLTDTLGRPFKWALPDTTIGPGEYLLVWADEDGMQGPLHANFRLSRQGEEIAIFDERGALIDSVTFGVQMPDVSYGRMPDGGESFTVLPVPTPGTANGGAVGLEPYDGPLREFHVSVYPNPGRGPVSVALSQALDDVRVEVFDILGRRVSVARPEAAAIAEVVWNGWTTAGAPAPAGMYMLRVSGLMPDLSRVVRSVPIIRLR